MKKGLKNSWPQGISMTGIATHIRNYEGNDTCDWMQDR